MGNIIDLTGRRFGRLLVIHRDGTDKWRQVKWRCLCDCGSEVNIVGSSLRNGDSQSCGCLQKESIASRQYKHGHCKQKDGESTSKEYRSCANMKRRCFDVTNNQYHNYGGRGIKVCDRWKDSFENFLEDMGECPCGMSIDRINNDRDYEPGNCRWADNHTQRVNSRNNRFRNVTMIDIDGEVRCLTDWCCIYNVGTTTVLGRLSLGWPIDKALKTPVRKRGKSDFFTA